MSRKILIVTSEWGFWDEELIGVSRGDVSGLRPRSRRSQEHYPGQVDDRSWLRNMTSWTAAPSCGPITNSWTSPRSRHHIRWNTFRGTSPDRMAHVSRETSVIVDYSFITGRSTPDSTRTDQMVVEVLERGPRRYGW